jgi:hypothetical protein
VATDGPKDASAGRASSVEESARTALG